MGRQRCRRSVGRIDPATNTVADSIPLSVAPTCWPSTERPLGDVVHLRSDRPRRPEIGKVIADINMPKPPASRSASTGFGWSSIATTRSRGSIPRRRGRQGDRRWRKAGHRPLRICIENVVVGDDADLDREQRGPFGQPDQPRVNRSRPRSTCAAAWTVARWWLDLGEPVEGTPDGGFRTCPADRGA